MLFFENDYSRGCHPEVLRALTASNMEPLTGYGQDAYSVRAAEKIREACGLPEAEVYFLSGGTQCNQVVLAAILRSNEGVIAADTGHVSLHEAGAIEYTGHKVISLPGREGKLSAAAVDAYVTDIRANNGYYQLVDPGAVYISQPTEYGTLYSLAELKELRAVCDKHGLLLYIDGARLGYGLASPMSDMTLKEFAAIPDVFYIGGTKVGALCGEAVVFASSCVPHRFFATVKQHGAMFAKGRVMSVQFDALFTDGLYERVSEHAIRMAMCLKQTLLDAGLKLYLDSPTNQQFAVVPVSMLAPLSKEARYSLWETQPDGTAVIRFCTDWATTEEDIAALGEVLRRLHE